MTLNQLYYFKMVAKYENYHRASEVLYISQPSISRSIAMLEKELGVVLFEKSGRGVTLSKAGRLFLEYAERIIAECEIVTTKMKEISKGGGKIDIGFVFPLAGEYMPHMVRSFLNLEENKDVTFSFYQNHTANILEKVKSGELDVGFGGYTDEDDMEYYPILCDEIVLITPKGHTLEGKKEVSIGSLHQFPIIGYDRKSWMGKYTNNLYRRLSMKVDIVVECPDEYSIMALVSEEFGIALVPNLDILDETRVNIHRISDVDLKHQIYMFWPKGRYQLPAITRFIEYMQERALLNEMK